MTVSKLKRLAEENNQVCVTISLNTHRTHPDNLQDEIVLKNLISDAKERVTNEFGKRDEAGKVLQKLDELDKKVDINQLLDSLHIFISAETMEIVRSIWSVEENSVFVDEQFMIKPLIKLFNRSREYLILQLSQNKTQLFKAYDESIEEEVHNHVFPFGESPHVATSNIRKSDSAHVDNLLKEHFRDIDKALVDFVLSEDKTLKVVVATTEANYHALLEASTRPEMYIGFIEVNHSGNDNAPWHLAKQSWEVVKEKQIEWVKEAIEEVKAASSQSKLSTDLLEIYQAAIDGNAELLIVNKLYQQPVRLVGDRDFELIEDANEHGALDDIISHIAYEVISKGGKTLFVDEEWISDLGNIALKKRY